MSALERRLDVSDLEPPEPLMRALAEAAALVDGEYLLMRHRRRPCLLYDNLEQRGFCHHTDERAYGFFEVWIWRCDDEVAAAAVTRQVQGE